MKNITLAELVTLKTSSNQIDHNGKVVINRARVEQLKSHILEALQPPNRIAVSSDMKIICGTHRREAVSELLSDGKLDPNFLIEIDVLSDDKTKEELARIALNNNFNNNNSRLYGQLVCSDLKISKKVFLPIFKAIEIATGKKYSRSKSESMAVKLGAWLNNNPAIVEQIRRGYSVSSVTGADLYNAKTLPEAGKLSYMCDPNVDLTDLVDRLAIAFSGFRALNELQDIVREKIGKHRTTLDYLFIAKGLRKPISQAEVTKIHKIIKNKGGQIHKCLLNFMNQPEAEEDTIMNTILEDKSMPVKH